jgi:hypothetical protein
MLEHAYSTFQRDLLAAKVKAAPDPIKRGRADQEMALAGMILSAYGGGAGYKGYQSNQGDAGYSGYLGNGQWDMGGGKTQGPTYLPGPGASDYVGTAAGGSFG